MKRVALLLAAFALSACSMLGMDSDRDAAAGATSPDGQMMRDIAQANLAEITTGQLALSKAQSAQVRLFAQHMIDEHTRMQSEGGAIASAKGMPTPKEPDAKHQAAAQKLESMSGESFDRAYMEQMVRDHQQTLELVKRAASQAKDADLRAHAQKAIPHVQQHLQMAQQLASAVGARASVR